LSTQPPLRRLDIRLMNSSGRIFIASFTILMRMVLHIRKKIAP
jgi:hypothetical protein